MNTKVCTKCNKEYETPTEFFHKTKRTKDGLQVNCKQCHNEWYQSNKERILNQKANERLTDLDKYRQRDKDQYLKHSEKRKKRTNIQRHSFAKYKIYAPQISQYTEVKLDEYGFLLTRCTYCNQQFNPTITNCQNHIRSINKLKHGEGKFYCSDNCKIECPTYKRMMYPKGYKKGTSREVDPLIRKMALERDNQTCQKCNKTIKEVPLHVHHVEGATEQPILSNDLDNVITYCIDCHKEVHSKRGCTYNDYKCNK